MGAAMRPCFLSSRCSTFRKKREKLVLTDLERLRTWHSLIDHSAMVLVGLVSALLAWLLPLRWVGMAEYFYFVIVAYHTVAGTLLGRRDRRLATSAHVR